jgi:ADP-ribosylation factor related protein 1
MFSLLEGLWHYLFDKPNLHVLVIGLDHAGKSSLLERIKTLYNTTPGLSMEKITPTIGMNLAKLNHMGAQVIIWDLGGQAKMRSIWEKYYAEANAVIYVVDAADRGRLSEAKMAYDAACDNNSLATTKVPVFTFANKQDVAGALSTSDLAANFNPTFASNKPESPKRIFGVSAASGEGIDHALHAVIVEAKLHKAAAARF